MQCDLCGKDGQVELYKALIEGSQLTVCAPCARYGKVLARATPSLSSTGSHTSQRQAKRAAPATIAAEPELSEAVVSNAGHLLKRKREELGLSQKEFANKIAEKESALHKIETGEFMMTLQRARQLEKLLGLHLIEEIKEEPIAREKKTSVMTLGDMIKIKSRQKITKDSA